MNRTLKLAVDRAIESAHEYVQTTWVIPIPLSVMVDKIAERVITIIDDPTITKHMSLVLGHPLSEQEKEQVRKLVREYWGYTDGQ